MDRYLQLVFEYQGTTEEFVAFLKSRRRQAELEGFMASLMTKPTKRRLAQIHIANSLEVFKTEVQMPSLLVKDPHLVDRWVALLHEMLCFIAPNGWVFLKITRDSMKRIARVTNGWRMNVAYAKLVRTHEDQTNPCESSASLAFPN
ncbi:MAG: hypothetical protein PHS79_04420 [Patescibacteria group bacterium]|nr:hypothetical protein [Patescibacteria group bacterium]